MQTHPKSRPWRRLFFAVFALLAIASSLAAQTYRVTDLGTINTDPQTGQRISHPAGINNAGQVAGESRSGTSLHAARFTNGLVEDLGTIPGGGKSTGVGINNLGQVAGDSEYSVNGGAIRHAAIFSNGTVTDLGFLPSWGDYARANGINDDGVAVGHSGASLSTTNTHAFIWDATNGMRDLGTLGGPYARALSINNSNMVTGNSRPATGFGASMAFIWDEVNGMRSIGTIAGDSSSGAFINANGHVAGTSTINGSDNRQHAFLYDGTTTMRDLGAIGNNDFLSDRSAGYGINIHDHVVGSTYLPYNGGALYQIPFIYRDGQMLNLETLVDASGADYRLYVATGINDAGQIAVDGFQRSTGEFHAVLLTPNDAPGVFISSGGSSIVSAGSNGVLDPGETVTVSLGAKNTGSPGVVCTTAGLTGTLQASGGVTAPSGPRNYGTLCSGSPAAFRDFTFTVDLALSCGSTVTVSLAMTDGTTNYGTLTYTFVTGNLAAPFAENFDGVAAPARPAGWTTTFSGGGSAVGTSTAFPDTAPNTTFFPEPRSVGLSELVSPTITLPTGVSKLTFRNLFNTEPTYDGMVLEISINGAEFQDILGAGGTFTSGGYNSTISGTSANPLAGRSAWSGLSLGTAAAPAYITTVANLPAAAAGQNVQLKWRLGTDASLAPSTNPGARIDSISINSAVCGGNAPVVNSAVSRKDHGAAGTFDVNLPLVPMAGAVGVECRSGAVAGEHQLLVAFAGPVTMSGASVTAGSASMASSSVSGSIVTINLAGVTDGQRIGVTLANVSDGVNLGSVMVPLGVLAGDTNGNGAVTGTDVSQTKAAAASGTMTAGTFRTDVNASGSINATDISIVKSKTGTTLP